MISIIIPVYNAAPYLSAMLDSILRQSYTDFELILVNDGSKDNSSEICHAYAETNDRIRVFDCENQGASAARNFGLRQATGDFVWFMDSDDLLAEGALQAALETQEAYCADMVIGGMNFCFAEEGTATLKTIDKAFAFSASQFQEHYRILFAKNYISSLWNKLIRRSVITEHGISMFEGLLMYEDYSFCMDVLLHCSTVACIPTVFYHYQLRNSGSLSHRYKPNVADMFRVLKQKISTYVAAFTIHEAIACLHNLMIYLAYECVKNEFRAKEKPRAKIRALLNHPDFREAMRQFRGYGIRYQAVHFMMKHRMVLALSVYLQQYHRKHS